MPLEENPYIVSHLKALISGQKLWGGQRCGSTLRLWKAILKISVLFHKSGIVQLQKFASVYIFHILGKCGYFLLLTWSILEIPQGKQKENRWLTKSRCTPAPSAPPPPATQTLCLYFCYALSWKYIWNLNCPNDN